jgi:hypothetical protein
MFGKPVGLGEVQAQEAALGALCAALDPESIPLPDAPAVVAALAAIERLAAGARIRLARRVDESGVWRREGHASAAHWLARTTGTSIGQARGNLETSRRLVELPHTDEAVQRGKLSAAQAEAVADAATAAPGAEVRLVEVAGRRSLGELRDECARTKAAADTDAEARHRRIRESRTCRRRTTADGAGEITYRSTLDEVAEIWAAIETFATAEFRRARSEGRREPPDAYAADGLLALARSGSGGAGGKGRSRRGADKIIVRIDWDAFVRGWPADGEMCEIAGLGPIPVSLVREMAASGDPFLAAVVTRGTDVATVAHLGRRATAAQRTALQWREPTCDVEGCASTWLEIDHRDDWAATRITALWLTDRKCGHHHDLKTYHGWASVPGVGKRPFVPPGHPDHPGHPHTRPPPNGDDPDPGPDSDPGSDSDPDDDLGTLMANLETAIAGARARRRAS